MERNSKQSPKSCGCKQCSISKNTKCGHFYRKSEERAFRHKCKIRLNKMDEEIEISPHGDRLG